MSISFNEIPVDIRIPGQYLEFDHSRAVGGLAVMAHKILVIGTHAHGLTPSDPAPTNVPVRVTSAEQAKAFFGRGSMLAGMFEKLKRANAYTETWALSVNVGGAPSAGEIAVKKLTFTGTGTAAFTLHLYLAGRHVPVLSLENWTGALLAGYAVDAINALPDLPATASKDIDDKLVLTAKWKGMTGNDIDVRVNYRGETLPPGLGVAVASTTVPDTEASLWTVLGAIEGEWFNTIIMPYSETNQLTQLNNMMAERWGPLVQQEGQVFMAFAGSHAEIGAFGESLNSLHLTVMGTQKSPTPPWEIAAVVGAVDAFEPDPARPRQTLRLPGVLPPEPEDRYGMTERNLHLFDGISTFIVDRSGNVAIERLITTYQTNAFGLPDISYLDVCTARTLAYLRFTVRARIAQKYGRHKLAGDSVNYAPGQAIVTPRMIRAELIALFTEWEKAGLAEDIEQFKNDLQVVRSTTDPNRIDAIIPPNVVNQFRVFAAAIQFRL